MIEIYTGKTGTGKSLTLAKKVFELLHRNERWLNKTGLKRRIISNVRFSHALEHLYPGYIEYWADPEELILYDNVDVIWDEIATNLDATQWEHVPLSVKAYLRQHRKRGVDIYGTTQRFGDIYNGIRSLTDFLWVCHKAIGSPSPAATKPEVKNPWGIIWLNEVDPVSFEKDVAAQKHLGFKMFFIRHKYVDIYDTLQRIEPGRFPPLKHEERRCSTCGQVKVYHA